MCERMRAEKFTNARGHMRAREVPGVWCHPYFKSFGPRCIRVAPCIHVRVVFITFFYKVPSTHKMDIFYRFLHKSVCNY